MVGTVGLIGDEERQTHGFSWTLACYSAGSLIAGSALGALLGLAGRLLAFGERLAFPSNALLIAGLCLSLGLGDLGLIRTFRPQLSKQVPQRWWHSWNPRLAAFSFGAILAVPGTTFVPTGSFYVPMVLAVVTASPIIGATTMALFALFRALSLEIASVGLSHGERLAEVTRKISVSRRLVPLANGLAMGFVAGACGVLALANR